MIARRAGLAAVLSLGAAVGVHAAQDRWFPPPADEPAAILYLRSPATVSRLALEFKGFMADVYWIRALQHFGRERISTPPHVATFSLLYPLLDLTTTLDPSFSIAYRFGSIFLGEPFPGGPGRPDLAVALLEKGIRNQPAKWQYMQDIGFVYYWHLHDYKSAARWFERAADVPGAPSWMRPLAAVTLVQGGQRSAARELWEQIAQSDEPWLRDQAALRLTQLRAMDAIDVLQERVRVFQQAHPGEPITWARLMAVGFVRGVPVDPTGAPLVVDAATGRVSVSSQSSLYPMPGDGPGARH